MSIFKMKPYYSEKIWGYEKWNLSTHKAGSSIIEENGELLSDYLKSDLPILIKIIKSEQSLSVQVHQKINLQINMKMIMEKQSVGIFLMQKKMLSWYVELNQVLIKKKWREL